MNTTENQIIQNQSQRIAVIADRTLRTENQLDRITRELHTIQAILREIRNDLH